MRVKIYNLYNQFLSYHRNVTTAAVAQVHWDKSELTVGNVADDMADDEIIR